MAKNPKSEIGNGDRIVMMKGSPVKEGTVINHDEMQAQILFDDTTIDWVNLPDFYISQKGSEITIGEGLTWWDYKTKQKRGNPS